MITPVDFKKYPITQGWGGNAPTYAQFGLKGHNGLDIGTPHNTDVYSPHSGKVIEVVYDATGYGLYMKIENDKEGSVLAHLKENLLAVGATVMEGQLIAKSDNTGFSTGAHLHWGYYRIPRNRQDGYLGYIDPTPYINLPTSTQTESIELLKQQINDLKETEKRLKLEHQKALADKERECEQKLAQQKRDIADSIDEIIRIATAIKK